MVNNAGIAHFQVDNTGDKTETDFENHGKGDRWAAQIALLECSTLISCFYFCSYPACWQRQSKSIWHLGIFLLLMAPAIFTGSGLFKFNF